jgi:DNA-binding NarL/FixJ family response regulator
MREIKVAIVEDNATLREGLSVILKCSPGFKCSGAYASAEEALQQIPMALPDVVLMDINLPKSSGIECVRQLTNRLPRLLVIMLTIEEDPRRVFESLQAGATGYLVKNEPLPEILAAIEEVYRGGSPISSQIARMIVQSFHRAGPVPPEEQRLTSREHEILELTAKGFRTKEVASDLGISLRTVETHLRSISDKLHVRSRVEAVTRFLQKPAAVPPRGPAPRR